MIWTFIVENSSFACKYLHVNFEILDFVFTTFLYVYWHFVISSLRMSNIIMKFGTILEYGADEGKNHFFFW